MKTKDKIIQSSIELFNRNGVTAVTTNHIAKEMNISPGNLYFHFCNKEEIIRHIFKVFRKEMYSLWRTKKGQKPTHPLEILEYNYELFWRYRFFHREIYYLRRKDLLFAKDLRKHNQKMMKISTILFKRWLKIGWMKPIENTDEINFLANVLLAISAAFLYFFESAEVQPTKEHIKTGKRYIARLIVHYTDGEIRNDFESFLQNS